jgi:signal transduction histidine kinase
VTIFVMAVMPLVTAYYLLENSLRTSLNLGFNPQIVRTLDASAGNLRTLARIDPAHAAEYRAQFDELEELRQVYSDPEFVKRHIEGSLEWYFALGLSAAVLLSVVLAAVLSRRIARSHAENLAELMRERDKVHYLQEMSSWQELARMLAHEIKNPLTPIEVLVTSLSKAFVGKTQQEFLAHLENTQLMIGEELQHLKATVSRFSEFARLPQVQLEATDLAELLGRQLKSLPGAESADIELHAAGGPLVARVDSALFRQVLINLVRNAIEANAGRRVRVTCTLQQRAGSIELRMGNDGVPVDAEIVPRMFDPYISTKTGKDNMGLGLAIVKKIVLEHGGDIRYEEVAGAPGFVIALPVVAA